MDTLQTCTNNSGDDVDDDNLTKPDTATLYFVFVLQIYTSHHRSPINIIDHHQILFIKFQI